MLRKIEKNAKSKEEALRLAAEEFGVPVEELSYTVEREVGKGLMGLLLGKEVIISAWITKEAEEEEEKLRKLAQMRAKSGQTAQGANPYAPKQNPEFKDYVGPEGRKKKSEKAPLKAEAPKAEAKPETKKEEAPAPQPVAEPKKEKKDGKKREVTEQSLKDADYFVNELVHKMGLSDAKAEVVNGGESVDVTVSGSRMGLLIGKRGDTLDAVQYLTSLYVNKEKNSYIKVNVDTEGYRAKREDTLVKLAKSLERRVLRDGKQVVLEPMSPNERRIIHSALQNSSKIKTYSIGEEPNRKVVVAMNDGE
ncbi:MAG: RNA-binding cell elongation regulator Jag/EloR [Clostridia bacterium]|nr:RNA-binding cell elongation regulator Jag/EloR [Clostridia bacterium]